MNIYLSKIDKSRQRLNELSRREAFSHYIKHGSVPRVWNEIMDASDTEEKFLRYLTRYNQALSYKANVGAKERSATHYIWRTKHDGRVRSEHAVNDGKLFSWNERPVTGHPGEEYNCRCVAEPYVEGATEYATHNFSSNLAAPYGRWDNLDFVKHYFFGNGRPVTLLEIGHLQEIAEQYAYHDKNKGAFRRLSGQIASKAREGGMKALWYYFEGNYDFKPIQFSHGTASIYGYFNGDVTTQGAMLLISGESQFYFTDTFKDPLDTFNLFEDDLEVGGTPYEITGEWTANFVAQVFTDESRSQYFHKGAND